MKTKILLVIDIQKQFKDKNGNYEKVVDFIQSNYNKYDKVIATYFKNKNDSFYENKLEWNGCKSASEKDIEFNIPNFTVYEKISYGFILPSLFDVEIDIIGCDSDACVLATCFYLWDKEIEFKVLTDYIYTNSKTFSNEVVIELMKRNFGKCII